MSASETSPTIAEVLRFEDLPLGSRGTRRAVVRWSDGSVGEALTWYSDLCGHPHKSVYAETCVMPRNPGIAAGAAETSAKHRHNPGRPVTDPAGVRIADAGLLAPARASSLSRGVV